MKRPRRARLESMDSPFIAKWDTIIRRTSYAEWCKLTPSSCEWEDVAQEVRLVFLKREKQIMAADYPFAFVTVSVRREARRALYRLCRAEIKPGHRLLHIEDDPTTSDLFYSSSGSASDDYLD